MECRREYKKNRKRNYSIKLLMDAYIALLENNAPESISVTDVCRLADVNRSTFYSNFKDIYDLAEYIWDDLANQFRQVIGNYKKLTEQQFYDELFKLYGNPKYQKLLRNVAPEKIANELHQMIFENVIKPRFPYVTDVETFQIVHEYAAAGNLKIIQSWLEGKYIATPEQMSKLVCALTIASIGSYDPGSFTNRT